MFSAENTFDVAICIYPAVTGRTMYVHLPLGNLSDAPDMNTSWGYICFKFPAVHVHYYCNIIFDTLFSTRFAEQQDSTCLNKLLYCVYTSIAMYTKRIN